MKSDDQSRKSKKQKLLWILPLFVLPFVTLLFWALGGGKTTATAGSQQKGFNLNLPSAQNGEDQALDKLNYYDQASQDSLKVDELRKKDPNYRFDTLVPSAEDSMPASRQSGGLAMSPFQSPKEQEAYHRLEALQRAINTPPAPHERSPVEVGSQTVYHSSSQGQELERMMQSLDAPAQPDPEMAQIGGMLENILDIQYPERVEQKLKEASAKERGRVFSISPMEDQQIVSSISGSRETQTGLFGRQASHSGFFSLDDTQNQQPEENAVTAFVAETQTVVNGSTVKLLLGQDIFISGAKIPKNTFVYGTAALKGERLTIEITTIRYGSSLFPVELTVYDLDGLTGLYIPGAINRDVAKASADRSMQSLGVTTLSDSWGAQAAGAGIEAAKGLFSKKVKLVKVTFKAGYALLLRDEKQKE